MSLYCLEVEGNLENIRAPQHPGDAGYDLMAGATTPLMSGVISRIPIGIRIVVPLKHWGLIIGRSSANIKGIFVLPSVIDSGYRGLLYIYATLLVGGPLIIGKGISIAQLILMPESEYTYPIREVTFDLDDTDRGQAGFGSTGCGV